MPARIGRLSAAALLALAAVSSADIINYEFAEWSARGLDDDLFRFVTRPDLTPPKLDVRIHKKGSVAPGYLFLAPYDCLSCGHVPTTTYITQQIGPHIYTQEGELVWSGNELFPDRKVFDFRPVMINDEFHLSLIAPPDSSWRPYHDGVAMVLNASYQPVYSLNSTQLGYRLDLHEFNILADGRTALLGLRYNRESDPSDDVDWKGHIAESLVTEIDLETGVRPFNWTASEHVSISESSNPPGADGGTNLWDWFHMNSIDKDVYGNYLISARATNTIYYIAPTGRVIWRLGGPKSSFEQDFVFSRQHHARVRKQSKTKMIISFFDNAADDSGLWTPTSQSSGLNVVTLDLKMMTASLTRRHARPDDGLSEAKGNMEYLPNGGTFGGWGENGYMSEYMPGGLDAIYEASFASRRFANYRAYKMEFVGKPLSKPITKAFVSTNSRGQLKTTIYVSWNGATEVETWRFYSRTTAKGVRQSVHLGNAAKTGFETTFTAVGYHPVTYAEAVDIFGNSLSNSTVKVTEIPIDFHDASNPMRSPAKQRDEGDISIRMAVAFFGGIVFTMGWKHVRYIGLGFAHRVKSIVYARRSTKIK